MPEALLEEYEAFAQRDLSGYQLEYLFLDASYESLRQPVQQDLAAILQDSPGTQDRLADSGLLNVAGNPGLTIWQTKSS